MAANRSWTVKTAKRKAPVSATLSEKRRRRSTSIEDGPASFPSTKKQQTLTQIQYFPYKPMSFDDDCLELIAPGTVPRSSSSRPMQRLKKKNSTLTQMDFLTPKTEVEEMDATYLQVENPYDDPITQVDGPYQSPRKQRPRKYGHVKNGIRKQGSISLSIEESQDFLHPRKRRRRDADTDDSPASSEPRRRLARHISEIPKVLSDPVENFNVIQDAFEATGRLPLETRESNEDGEDLSDSPGTTRPNAALNIDHLPSVEDERQIAPERNERDDEPKAQTPIVEPGSKTPRRERNTIPSSQSPECLSPITKKTSTNTPKRSSRRQPLAEMSTNTPSRRMAGTLQGLTKCTQSPKRKICVLKLPQKVHEPRTRVLDSQIDIWAVQPISSQKPDEELPPVADELLDDLPYHMQQDESQLEILETSQVMNLNPIYSSPPNPANTETQSSLPSLAKIFGHPLIRESQQTSKDGNIPVEGFARESDQGQSQSLYVDFFNSPKRRPGSNPVGSDLDENEEDEDFGSPILNDTQFDRELLARIPTSPLARSDVATLIKYTNPHDTIRLSSSSSSKETMKVAIEMPPPSLVNRVDYQKATTTVPLNDMSSPMLPPRAIPAQPTQASAHPASMPHPSQVSTQEPSQRLPTSSMAQIHSPDHASSRRLDRIIIKDSSSPYQPISQLPEYDEDEVQLHADLAIASCANDEDEGDDNDDLDPYSDPPRLEAGHIAPQHLAHLDAEIDEDGSKSYDEPEHLAPPRPTQSSPSIQPKPMEGQAAAKTEGHTEKGSKSRKDLQTYIRAEQENFTQNGHVTAARIEDMRKRGLIPEGFEPEPFQVPTNPRDLLPAWMFDDDDEDEEL